METKTASTSIPQYVPAANAEAQGAPSATRQEPAKSAASLGGLFGVYVDRGTWGALIYMLISLVTGVVYFTWGITGVSLAIGFSILVIGVPFAILFLLSVRGLTLLESRIVETLIGVQIPRGPFFAKQGLSWLGRLKALLTDRRTRLSLLYLVLQLPLGVVYFSLSVTLLALALGFMAIPLAYVFGDPQTITISGQRVFLQPWTLIFAEVAGFLFLTLGLHVIRAIGRLHGRYARALLVG